MARLKAPGIRVLLSRQGVRLSHRADVEADPVGWVWNEEAPDRLEARLWLDANAPGWHTEIGPLSVEECEIPIGPDERGVFLMFDAFLKFSTVEHREAWLRRVDAIAEDANRLKARIAAQQASAAEGVRVCGCCGGFMQAGTDTETTRLAQFAFVCTFDVQKCQECGARSLRADAFSAMEAAYDLALANVGLPDYGHPLWTDDIGLEWRRRAAAEPEITVTVHPGKPSESICDEVRTALATSGRVVRDAGGPSVSLVAPASHA